MFTTLSVPAKGKIKKKINCPVNRELVNVKPTQCLNYYSTINKII